MTEVLNVYLKDADDVIDPVSIDLTDYLASGEAVTGTPSWAVEGGDAGASGALAISGTPTFSSNVATALVTLGNVRQVYQLRCRFVTSQGRTFDILARTVRIRSA